MKAANPWCMHLPSHALALQLQADLSRLDNRTKAKIAAGVREQRKAADCSSSSTTSESTSSTHRRQTPAEPQTSSSDIAPTSSSSSVSETRPRLPARSAISKEAIALSKGAVQGKNGWWRPPASAARTVPPPSARNVKKTRPAASRREEVEVGLSREIIDLTKDIAGESGAKELLNRLRAHSTVAQSLLSETPPLLPLDSDDDDEVAEPSPGSAPSESRGRRFESIPSTTHTHVHNKLHYQSPHPRDASPKPSSKLPISSAANIASSRSLSSPSPSRCQFHSTAQSQSTADHKPSTLPTTSMATSSASRSAPDTRLSLGGDLSHATTTSLEATARVGAKPAQSGLPFFFCAGLSVWLTVRFICVLQRNPRRDSTTSAARSASTASVRAFKGASKSEFATSSFTLALFKPRTLDQPRTTLSYWTRVTKTSPTTPTDVRFAPCQENEEGR